MSTQTQNTKTTQTSQSQSKTSKYAPQDFSAFQQKLDDLKNQKSSFDKFLLKLDCPENKGSENSAIVRILPYPHTNPERAYNVTGGSLIETFFHYNVGNEKQVACPKYNLGEKCAICSHVDKLYKQSHSIARKLNIDTANKEKMRANDSIAALWDQANELRVTKRIYVPILVVSINDKTPSEEQSGVKFFGMNKTLGDKLITQLAKKRKHNPLSLDEGYAIKFTSKNTGKQFKGKPFGELDFEILTDDDPSPILPSGDIDEIDVLIESVPNIWITLLKPRTEAEVQDIMATLLEEEGPQQITSNLTNLNVTSNGFNNTNGFQKNISTTVTLTEEQTEDLDNSIEEMVGDLDELLEA